MIHVKRSRIGMLPCLLILVLWFLLPIPNFPHSPPLDESTKEAAMKAVATAKLTKLYGRFIKFGKQPGIAASHLASSSSQNGVGVQSAIGQSMSTSRSSRQVLFVSATSSKPCVGANGDFYTLLSVKNKQDYARKYGYQFLLSMKQTDVNLKGAWNKVALIRDLLIKDVNVNNYIDNDNDEVEEVLLKEAAEVGGEEDDRWLVWFDYDALIVDFEFKIPFDKYRGKDLVMWGQAHELFDVGDAHMGLNTGVFLVRNTQWSREFFQRVSQMGYGNGKGREEEMKGQLGKYDWALFDQNGFAYVLRTWKPDISRSKVYLENSYVLNGYWKSHLMSGMTRGNKPFVKHFMGCQFCSGISKVEAETCSTDYEATWEFIQNNS